jgi:hypothetical protein
MHVDPTTARDPLQRTPRGFTSLHDRNDAMQRLRLAVDQTCRLITHQLERCPDQHIHHLSMQLPTVMQRKIPKLLNYVVSVSSH